MAMNAIASNENASRVCVEGMALAIPLLLQEGEELTLEAARGAAVDRAQVAALAGALEVGPHVAGIAQQVEVGDVGGDDAQRLVMLVARPLERVQGLALVLADERDEVVGHVAQAALGRRVVVDDARREERRRVRAEGAGERVVVADELRL